MRGSYNSPKRIMYHKLRYKVYEKLRHKVCHKLRALGGLKEKEG